MAFLTTRAAQLIAMAGALGLAWSNRFVQDDAFIAFRYASHLVRGQGLVWNPGERIEGYTNFLWTVVLAAGMALRFDPVAISTTVGLTLAAFTLGLSYELSVLLSRSRLCGLLTVALLGTNFTFSAYGTGGLETQLQTCLVTGSAVLAVRSMVQPPPTTGGMLAIGILLAGAILTRLDSVLVAAVVVSALVASAIRQRLPSMRRLLAALIFPPTVLTGVWFAWKLWYYGSILPQSFAIKVTHAPGPMKGLLYLLVFVNSYWLWAVVPLCLVALFRRRTSISVATPGIVVLVWLAYVVRIGGDFMEFRLLVPILPICAALATAAIAESALPASLRLLLIVVVVLGSLHHALTFRYDPSHGIEPVRELTRHLYDPSQNWVGIGRTLADVFQGDPSVIIATTAAGAIPFYSNLRTVDMLGINDDWVAQHGQPLGAVPGHQRLATYGYLRKRGVHLVISHPVVLKRSDPSQQTPLLPRGPGDPPVSVTVVGIPLDSEHKLAALYLTPHPTIDRAIRERGWTVGRVDLP